MNAVCPAVSKFLLQGAPRKITPLLVNVSAQFVGSGNPNHYRGRVSHIAKTRLTLLQRLLGPHAFGDVTRRHEQTFDATKVDALRGRQEQPESSTTGP